MPEQRQKDHDRQRYTKQPKQDSTSHTHGFYLLSNRIFQTHSKNVAVIVWFLTRNELMNTFAPARHHFAMTVGTIEPIV
jgi:hypothetical protein